MIQRGGARGSRGPTLHHAILLALVAAPALGQAPAGHPPTGGVPGELPPLPAGSASIRGQVSSSSASGASSSQPGGTAGLPVALYALSPDGSAGIGNTLTDESGAFRFDGVSNDPAIAYLLGTRYAAVPFGERVSFTAGQSELVVALEVADPTPDGSTIVVDETAIRVEWTGNRVSVLVAHTLSNRGERPVLVPPGARVSANAPFRARLPAGAEDFSTPTFNAPEAFEQRGQDLLYWGPLYAGSQELRYSYTLPPAPNADEIPLTTLFPMGSGGVRILAPETGPSVRGDGLTPAEPIEIDGRRFAALDAGAQPAGARLALSVRVPQTTTDASALTLGRADLTVEVDDTALTVTHQQQLAVAEGAHLAGSRDAPLLRLDLPAGAVLEGVSRDADGIGVVTSLAQDALLFVGPMGPGEHQLSFRYRLPASEGRAELALRFPITVPTLALQVADTGLRIETERLHRRRPQVIGTRTWLFREAFDVSADETVRVGFRSLEHRPLPRIAAMGTVLAASALAMFFVMGPLRSGSQTAREETRAGVSTAAERDRVYTTIRDLEHDFETGKVAEDDYERMLSELRAEAVSLLRVELEARGDAAESEAAAAPGGTDAEPAIRIGGFCPGCGGRIDASWRFCSHCGGSLAAGGTEPPV